MGSVGLDSKMLWEQIERSESYLVCSMFEEAASLASSILNDLSNHTLDTQFYDMLESSGMVLLQSLNHLGRASEILNQLKQSFPSLAPIPVQLLLTGACFQIAQNPSGVEDFLQEYLSKWRFVDDRYYLLAAAEARVEGCGGSFSLGVDEYLDVVELYVMKLLGATQNNIDLAISWVEKAQLPEDRRQGLLRRLHSLHSVKATTLSQRSSTLLADSQKAHSSNLKQLNISEGSPKVLDDNRPLNDEKTGTQAVLKLSKQVKPSVWWLRTINLKLGNAQVTISKGKVALGGLFLLIYWILRRKRASLKGVVQRQALNIKKAVVDLWQLAFSYQVNPLAAVQSPPVSLRGGQR